MSEQAVKDLARVELRHRLGGVRRCVAPVVVGGKDRRITVHLDHQKLEARNLSPVAIVKAFDQGNLMVSPGTAYIGNNQIALDTNAMLRTVEDIGDIPIVFEPDRPILLRDVSTSLDDAVIQKSQVRVNGKQQVCVLIYRQQEARSLNLAEGVKSAIPEMESELPEGSKLEFVIDQTKYVRKAIESLVHEGFIVAILVSYMILVFLDNWRMTVIATIALLLSILGAIIMVPLLRSFVMPTIIMAAVPLGLIGVLTMLWLPECLPSFAASVPRKEARRHRDDRRLTSMRR